MKVLIICRWCKSESWKEAGVVNRSQRKGAPIFCGKTCFGLHHRSATQKTEAQKKEEKRLYDMQYREKNVDILKVKKAAAFQKSYDPVKAAVERKKRMPKHVEYCRQPEYKKY